MDEDGNDTFEYETAAGLIRDAENRHYGNKSLQAIYQKGYVIKLKYTNKSIIKLVHRFMNQVSGPKVIVIHGDHGSRKHVFLDDYQKTDLTEAFSTFCAVYSDIPVINKAFKQMSDFNVINIYRILFDKLFATNTASLENKQYYIGHNSKSPEGYKLITIQHSG